MQKFMRGLWQIITPQRGGPGPILTRSLWIAVALGCALAAHSPARATETCAGERLCDEQQIGPYVAPPIALPDGERPDPRGRPVPMPVPGLDEAIRHRPGAGVWMAPAPGNSNLFLRPGRDRVTIDMRLDF